MADDTPDDDPLVQVNVRVRRSLRDRIDQRRATLVDPKTKRPMSRDRWLANAAKYALEAPTRTPTVNTQRRTAPPR